MFWIDEGARVGFSPMLMDGRVLVSWAATTAESNGNALNNLMVKWLRTKRPLGGRDVTVPECERDAAWYDPILMW